MKRFVYGIKIFLRNFAFLYFLLIVIFEGLPKVEGYGLQWITLLVILILNTLYRTAIKNFDEEKTE